jgi:hypothetical protein
VPKGNLTLGEELGFELTCSTRLDPPARYAAGILCIRSQKTVNYGSSFPSLRSIARRFGAFSPEVNHLDGEPGSAYRCTHRLTKL